MTLNDICKEIYNLKPFSELPVMYRTNTPDTFDGAEKDTLFGYCKVHEKMSDFSVESLDGDDYNMNDEIERYDYNPEYFDGLVVWFHSEWVG